MALTKTIMAAEWAKRKAKIDEMLQNEADDKKIFEELCNPVYSGNEYENVPGIIYRNTDDLIDIACHIIITDCAMSCVIDSTIIAIPDHAEILTAIFTQLIRDNVEFKAVLSAIDKLDANKWFSSFNEKCVLIRSNIEGIWEYVENILLKNKETKHEVV